MVPRLGWWTRTTAVVAMAACAWQGEAIANPALTASFVPGAFSASDQAVINSALSFYNSLFTSTFAGTIGFATIAGSGARSSFQAYPTISSAAYRADLASTRSSDFTDTTVNANLTAGTGNPVTGTPYVELTATLASVLGIPGAPQLTQAYANCPGAGSNLIGCVLIGTAFIATNNGGTPASGLLGVTEHEVDEVLGTASALPNGKFQRDGTTLNVLPANLSAADLFRFQAPGVPSFFIDTNDSNQACSSTAVIPYFSIDGGVTDLSNYNNCANGADYGDWSHNAVVQVQDAFGGTNGTAMLVPDSPEVTLLDAIGYNIPEPGTFVLSLFGLGALRRVTARRAGGATPLRFFRDADRFRAKYP